MGSLTDAFSSLNDILLSDYKALSVGTTPQPRRIAERDILLKRFLTSFSPGPLRFGSGSIVDPLDRQVGPFEVVAHAENYPAVGDVFNSLFLADGTVYALGVSHEWSESDLATFSDMTFQLKTLQRKNPLPLFCGIVDFGNLPYASGIEFLRLPVAKPIDFFYSVGQFCVIRNSLGWYGSQQDVPFVTERGGPEALKSFALLMLQVSQQYFKLPFSYADYQHL